MSKLISEFPGIIQIYEQPELSLRVVGIREHPLNHENTSPILRWKKDSNFPKSLLDSISSLGFKSKFLYSTLM